MATTPSFLSLPPEIRSRIYEFALTPEDGLRHVHNRAPSGKKSFFYERDRRCTFPQPTLEVEFNQLKYVNHQLYSKTAALELKYSQLLIFNRISSPRLVCGAQVVSFLDSMSPAKRAWLSVISIQETTPNPFEHEFLRDSATTLSRLDQFCGQHTNLTVLYEPPDWWTDPYRDELQKVLPYWRVVFHRPPWRTQQPHTLFGLPG